MSHDFEPAVNASDPTLGRQADRGSVLPMVLVLTVVGSIIVVALQTFAVTLFRVQPELAERDDTFQSARSAMEMAIVFQRDAGPGQCYTDTEPASFSLNGHTATVSCSPAGNYFGTARNQLGLITTSTDPATALTGPAVSAVSGEIYVSGADPAITQPWYERVGEDPEADGSHVYPTLPPVPAYVRGTVNPPQIGGCSLYFPGRYLGPLVLGPGDHYFASGVYLFNHQVTVESGAEVVVGQGPIGGCAGGDAPAAGASSSPSSPAVSGRGATFLFGGAGRLDIQPNARFEMNRRVSDASTRGTDGVSIRTINFGPAPPPAVPDPSAPIIPADVVFLDSTFAVENPSCDASLSTDQCLQDVANHSVVAIPGAPPAAYVPSALADPAVRIDQSSGSAATNAVIIDGMILTPNADVVIDGGVNPDHLLRVSGGIVAESVQLNHVNPSSGYLVGVIDQAVQRRFRLAVQLTAASGARARSDAVLDVNANGQYAINAWSVDASS